MDKGKLKRINVVGCSGSGKSTIAEAIAKRRKLPLIELDQLFWNPNWQETSKEKMEEHIRDKTSHEEWVLVGNYQRYEALKWKDVETVVWVDPPFIRNLWQITERSVRRAIHKKEIWEGTGCYESFYKTFCTRDSIILWMLRTYSGIQKEYSRKMNSQDYEHIHCSNQGTFRIFLVS